MEKLAETAKKGTEIVESFKKKTLELGKMASDKIGEENMEKIGETAKESVNKVRETGGKVKGMLQKFFSKKNEGGWALWEILTALAIMGVMGYEVMGLSSSTSSSNNASTAASEAESLQAEMHSMFPNAYYPGSGDISSSIATQQSTPANMLTGGCSTGLCGPFSGSSFSVIPGGSTFQITLSPVSAAQCAQVIEQQAGSGLWTSINGLNVATSLPVTTVQSACSGGSITWASN